MPNSVIGTTTVMTVSDGAAREAPGAIGASRPAPLARSAEERKRCGSTARSDHLWALRPNRIGEIVVCRILAPCA